MKYAGIWHVEEMETWDEDYFNMEVQAYIKVDSKGFGDFQFGLVTGEIHGEAVQDDGDERFEFTWEGCDEMDPGSGSGWFKKNDRNTIEGKIKIHHGDSSWFQAKRAKQRRGKTK